MLYPAKGMQNIPVLGRISPMGWLEFCYLRMKETLQKTFSLWQIRNKTNILDRPKANEYLYRTI